MTPRTFPFSPTSATSLMVGDLVPVQGLSGNWACLQVVEVRPLKRKNFIVALLPWRGGSAPGTAEVAGLVPLERALTRIEIFTEGHLQVIGNAEPNDAGQERWYGPLYVGRTTSVWGWKATIRLAQDVADSGLSLADPA
ncbi:MULTISPECIES: hypothetical protein [unclassified Arthrobacter]|uniref:hypothetical protein n=1 Tax=unclassified Arthrobacter TaxID=235627 RepID=UPI002102BAEF|nr:MULTISPECIES: hypothetical protein [unclassified Arthrobacter]MCQ1946049.1 hypothetical protein [Arthrobacter sp. zg-Y1116]MCQ1994271.1 hypothetical protein [Arthrobacter sp. zg-Y1171]UWX81632.1 hypothetical protein N2L00_14780 [Arthrobacter sp. zg-Y1171]